MEAEQPRLFGINNSNRDFNDKKCWGKNQFPNTFPASLCCYLNYKGLDAVYIKLDDKNHIAHDYLGISTIFGMNPESENLMFAFESPFTPYERLVIGNVPRIDLVTQDIKSGSCLHGIEIKLTALPDNSTCELPDSQYGCELVIRPDTIVYLACSIAMKYENDRNNLKRLTSFDNNRQIQDWSEANEVLPFIDQIKNRMESIIGRIVDRQSTFIVQPIWKTLGKYFRLAENCLDVFVWSNLAFAKFIIELSGQGSTITRQKRTLIWLFVMLQEYAREKRIDHRRVIDELSYNTKNDKAFASSGVVTHHFMQCKELTQPRIKKDDIKNIILGGGQRLLSPERRFDAILYNSDELFNG